MKLSVYEKLKREVSVRIAILKVSIVDTFNEETAYISENYSAIFSTVAYTITFAFFIKVIYGNIDSLAGYNEDQMLFFLFVSQASFYFQSTTYEQNVHQISNMVNTGEIDIWLSKPIPHLFYLSLRRISILSVLREVVPALFFLGLMIDWENLGITTNSLVAGVIIFILGQIAAYCLNVLSCIPVFWLGRNEHIYNTVATLQWLGRKEVPFEGFPQSLQVIFTSFLPIIISAGLSTSVFLNKSDARLAILYTSGIVLFFAVIKEYFWAKAMRAHSSASS